MTQKILVIEDRESHLQDAKKVLEDRLARRAIAGYDSATNLLDAQRLLKTNSYR